jgi:hypothetical protein
MVMITDKGKAAADIVASLVRRKWYLFVVVAAGFALVNPVVNWHGRNAAPRAEVKCLPMGLPRAEGNNLIAVSPTNTRQCLIDQGASPYIDILTKVLVGTPLGGSGYDVKNLKPYDPVKRYLGQDHSAFSYTMVGNARLHNLRCAIDEVNRNGIKGSIVELGLWRGGAMMLASALGKESGIQRDIYLVDAFDVISSYTSGGIGRNEGLANFLAVRLAEVKEYFKYFNLGGPHVHYDKGLFKDTLPLWKDKDIPIAILRIDGNFYDSYQDAMYNLYEKVPVGGIVVFDDISSSGDVLRFWVDFKKEQGLPEFMNRIDKHSAWFRKDKAVKLNWDYFHEPQDINKP